MKTAYIFHDAFSDPNSDWYPWMKTTLEGMGYGVVVPKFPTPAGQSYDSWKSVMRNYIDKIDPETIIIGHGIGGTFAMRLIEEFSLHIHGLFLVASYAEPLGHVGYDRVNASFINHAFDWGKVRNGALAIRAFAGQGDPFVPETISHNLASSLETTLIPIPDGGHINSASGFTQCIPLAQGITEGLGAIEKSMVVEAIPQEPRIETPPSLAEPRDTSPYKREDPTVHTMYQDMNTLVNSNRGSVASSLLTKARTDVATKKINQVTEPMNRLYIIGTFSVLLLVFGIGIWIVAQRIPASKNIPAPTIPSLLTSEYHEPVAILGKPAYDIRQAIHQALNIPDRVGMTDIYYTQGAMRASFPEVVSSLDQSSMPESLRAEFLTSTLSKTPVFMHGSVVRNGVSGHFLILQTKSYDAAFKGMRAWEPTLFRDIGVFMNAPESLTKSQIVFPSFRDEVIANKNIRVLRMPDSNDSATPSQQGSVLLGYFFLNDRTLVIVDNVAIIQEILERYATRQIYLSI